MRLVDLQPQWISADVFSFKCPHCRKTTLLCKRIPLSFKEQVKLVGGHWRLKLEGEHDWPIDFIPMREDTAWKLSGEDFETMTVTPSIDASASGHWHGNITKGEIVGGEQIK